MVVFTFAGIAIVVVVSLGTWKILYIFYLFIISELELMFRAAATLPNRFKRFIRSNEESVKLVFVSLAVVLALVVAREVIKLLSFLASLGYI